MSLSFVLIIVNGSSLVPPLHQSVLDNAGKMSDREHEMDDMDDDDIMDVGAEFDIPQKRASCWKHFKLITPKGHPKPRAACNWCGTDYACHSKLNDTKSLTHHLTYQCIKYPPSKNFTGSRQKLLSFQRKENNGETSANLVSVAFIADACKRALARMIIIDELPFSFVEGEGFRDFISVVQPMWNPPRDTLDRMVEECLLDWGIDKFLTVTVDNASSNNLLIRYLERKTNDRKATILNHEFLHVRCSAHILNLIVREGLQEIDVPIAKWKLNSSKYPIVSQMARDVLAIPVSTGTSEFAFSTGGRVIDPYRSSLSPKTVEALICTQQWIRKPIKINIREQLDELEALDSVLLQREHEGRRRSLGLLFSLAMELGGN
ncbi:hypothetical protein RHMOL_Rhmol11G0126300 [Rhododendron molle]|uniref:Uncharacterized protein n=1 Tax=Rhododendron molle TaxID=49168 RepID=A0ACC0LT08_RHOML|nr:hypothetical protein RHMOL_Rhmol11G0126300 [Rhododendron molle]